jgi:hypothetical protein
MVFKTTWDAFACESGDKPMWRPALGHMPLPEALQLLFTSTGDHMCDPSSFVSSICLACDGLEVIADAV